MKLLENYKIKMIAGILALLLNNCFSGAQKNVNPDFNFKSKYVEVLGSKMHYVEQGTGDPILFIHGTPTSSYLWRNIIPFASPYGRAIAIDLIGMGKSDKPDIEYRFVDHARYLEAFILKMNLKNITLVIHDWGSGLGFHYAMFHENNIKGIAFMEAVMAPMKWDDLNFVERYLFKKFRDPESGPEWIIEDNFFIERLLPMATGRSLTNKEMEYYRSPYLNKKDRKVLLKWPVELPFDDGKPEDTFKIISEYRAWLEKSKLPKLFLWVDPGANIKPQKVESIKNSLTNMDTIYVGKAKHFMQEDQPRNIGMALKKWLKKINK